MEKNSGSFSITLTIYWEKKMKNIKKYFLISATFIGMMFSISVANADTKLSIGSCPIGCTAYTWSAGIADVINNNVSGVSLTAEETKGYVANIKLLQNKELEISMATTLSSYQAYAATGPYKGSEKGKILSRNSSYTGAG